MGWTSSADTQAQVRLRFPDQGGGAGICRRHGIDAVVQEPHKRRPNIRPGGYAENFSPQSPRHLDALTPGRPPARPDSSP